jgi:hypothetical protein
MFAVEKKGLVAETGTERFSFCGSNGDFDDIIVILRSSLKMV